jgi:serine/threonine-protein kinase
MPSPGGRRGLPGDRTPDASGSFKSLDVLTPHSNSSSGFDTPTSESPAGPTTLAESLPIPDEAATSPDPDAFEGPADGRQSAQHSLSSPPTRPATEPPSTIPLGGPDARSADGTLGTGDSDTGDVRLVGRRGEGEDAPCDPRRYTVDGVPKRGGIGRVWRVRDTRLGRFLALKDLRPDRRASRRMVRRFLREAQVTAQLEHPGIVPVHELEWAADGQPYYLMRFVEGQTLREAGHAYHLARKKGQTSSLELRDLIQAVLFVARTLAYAHSRGVIHRDLKPQNVILGTYGEVFLLDWGLAGLRDEPQHSPPEGHADPADPQVVDSHPIELDPDSNDATTADDVLGTLPYMPPEQAEGGPDRVDRRSDVFGLGAILYSVLTDRSPLQGADTREAYWRLWREGVAPPRKFVPDVPRPLEAICLKALEGDPSRRYESAAAFADDLRRWLADEPVSAHAESLTTKALRWSRSHKTFVTAASALLVTAVVTLSIALLFIEQARREAREAEVATGKAIVEERRALREANQSWFELREALKALEKLSDHHLAHVPGLTEARRKLAETTLDHLNKLGARRPDDAEVHRLTMETIRALAIHDRAARRLGDAERRYRSALDRMTSFRDRTGAYDVNVAALLNYDLATVLTMQGRPAEALQRSDRVIEAAEAWLRQIPGASAGHRLKALGLSERGKNLRLLGKAEEAEVDLRNALVIWDELAKVVGTDKDQDSLLRSLFLVPYGLSLRDAGRLDEADQILASAVDSCRDLVREAPQNNDHRMSLNEALWARARLLLDRGTDRLDEAERMADEALSLAEELQKQYPEFPDYLERQAYAHDLRGDIYDLRGQFDLAESEHTKARELADGLLKSDPESMSCHALMSDLLLDLAAPIAEGRKKGDPHSALALVDEAERHLGAAMRHNDRDPDGREIASRAERLRKALRAAPPDRDAEPRTTAPVNP